MGISSRIEPARTLGKYSLIEKLGEGSLGPVYRGFDPELGRAVAVRILWDGIKWDAKTEELFFRECRSVAGLQHPNIAAIYEIGKEEKSPYIVTESLGTNSLESLIARKPEMTVESKLSIIVRIAEGLSYAHKNGILHRNLDPSKIHLTPDGSLKIRDFAIAHSLLKHLPRPGVRFGAALYLSPEQIQRKSGDARSDVFSAGMIFYELLTYFHPLHGQRGSKAVDNILPEAELPTFERFPDEPPGIWPILRTCLARDPKDRFQTIEEVLTAFKDLLKDLAEDTQFMLAELHASLAPLRAAAGRANASEETVRLLEDAQKILGGDGRADYVSLDRLMTGLIEQYPAIQEAAGELQRLEAERLQYPSKALGNGGVAQIPEPSSQTAAGGADALPQKLPDAEALVPGIPAQAAVAEEEPQIPMDESPIPASAAEFPDSHSEAVPPLEDTAQPSSAVLEEGMPAAVAAYLEATPQPEDPSQDLPDSAAPNPVEEMLPPQESRWIFRFALASLSILIIAVAVFIALEIGTAASSRNALLKRAPDAQIPAQASKPQPASGNATSGQVSGAELKKSADRATVSILLKEARSLADMNRFDEGKVLLHRILEIDPACEEAVTVLKEIEESSGGDGRTGERQSFQKQLARVSGLIGSGKLLPAKTELDRLQKAYPDSPEIKALRRKWQARNTKETEERARREEEQQKAARKQKEDEWNRRLTELFVPGKYNEAANAANAWLAEDPGNSRAREFSGRTQEIQRYLRAYASAMSENRYQDALNALVSAEKMNPEDSNFAELRRQAEARKAAAKATLTVYRLSGKGHLLLDGKPIGTDGEAANEIVSIGNHTLAVESDGRALMSRSQDYVEGQSVLLVYDLAKQHLRAMAETDKELVAQRKAREAIHRFALEHTHGRLRGSCSGVLQVSYAEVVYRPSKGSHGFRIPFNILKIKGEGKSFDLMFAADNTQIHSFKFQDVETANSFRQTWDELKALPR